MVLSEIEAPHDEPLTLEQARRQLRMDDITDDDDFIGELLIPAARQRGEAATNRQFIEAVLELWLDEFPCGAGQIEIPRPPLLTIEYVKYLDVNGTLQTLVEDTDYRVIAPAGPKCARGWIEPVYGTSWPTTRGVSAAVQIQFTAGYGEDGSFVPARLRMAMLQDVATLYAFREDILRNGAMELPMMTASKSVYRSFKSHPRPA